MSTRANPPSTTPWACARHPSPTCQTATCARPPRPWSASWTTSPSLASPLSAVAQNLSEQVGGLEFSHPITTVYNPLQYAWENHREYLERWGHPNIEALLVGINPGPWGMAQTGVPFGDPGLVHDWLGVKGRVVPPKIEHIKRPILGFDSPRREVSGQRLWGWAKERFGAPEAFFSRFFVHNFCPLCFMEETGRNRTPDKLRTKERAALFPPCLRALSRVVDILRPRVVVGIGKWAHTQIKIATVGSALKTGWILHPSPANPRANQGWAKAAEQGLADLGISL